MQKKLIALALASAFAAPAFAATSNVDVGGYMNMSFDVLDQDIVGTDSKMNVSSNSSNIYFKGSEDLGGGMKAFWQIQTYFDAGATGNADFSFGGTGNGVATGNTFVGLDTAWGKALMGKHEAPYKLVGRKYDFFNNTLGDSRNIIAFGGNDVRPNNVIAYGTPNFSGFTALVAYVTNLGAGPNLGAQANAVSANAGYDNGPLSLGLGYQKLSLPFIGASDPSAWRFGASYKFGDFKVAALYQQENNVGGVAANDSDAWGLGASYAMGAFTLKGQYYTLSRDLAANLDSDMWALGVDYSLSKRTSLYGVYASMDNDIGAARTPFGGGHGDNPGTVGGGNPDGFSLGVVHKF
ncbi:MAG: porin [Pseudomonadota bacterium]